MCRKQWWGMGALAAVCLLGFVVAGCVGDPGDALLLEPSAHREAAGPTDFERGLHLLENSQYEEALRAFDLALKDRPDDPAIHYHRGVAFHCMAALHQGGLTEEGDRLLTEANASYRRAVELGSTDARAYYDLGHINTGGGHSDETLQLMNRALGIDPNYIDALYERARTLWSLGRTDEALRDFDRVVELRPRFARAHMRRARLLMELDCPEDALAAHDRAVELAPRDSKVHFNRGRTLTRLGRYEEALESHDRAVELWPRFHAAHMGRGEALEALLRAEEALGAYATAERLDGYGRTVAPEANTNWMAVLLKGRLLARLGRYRDALKAYDAALGTQPRNQEISEERRVVERKMRARAGNTIGDRG